MMNCILAGVGGQGTVLASKLIAQAAMDKGLFARTAETIGMAQRGGCVVSHLRVGREVYSPMVPQGCAHLLIGFEPSEAVRCLPYLRPDGQVVVSKRAVKPITASLAGSPYDGSEMLDYLKTHVQKVILVDSEAICQQAGSAKVLNVSLLGAAVASGALGISLPEMEATIRKRIPERFVPMNLRALELGAQAYFQP